MPKGWRKPPKSNSMVLQQIVNTVGDIPQATTTTTTTRMTCTT
jgi:hypothetical protein